jgi:hypothetical protein
MFHSELYSSSLTTGTANAFQQVTAIFVDNVLPAQNNGYTVLQQLPFLASVIMISTSAVHVRPQANSMLPFPYITYGPNNRGSAAESPVRMLDLTATPMPLRPTEEFDVFATQNSGGAETPYILVSWCDGPPHPLQFPLFAGNILSGPVQVGRAFTVHGTASVTLTASVWSSVAFTLDQTLPPGTYGLIGLRGFSATGKYCRLLPSVPPQWRPGTIAVRAYDAMDPWYARAWPTISGKVVAPMGIWAQFPQNVFPQVEFFATSADTAEEAWFDLVYLSNSVMPTV